jgi:hypothetical protein
MAELELSGYVLVDVFKEICLMIQGRLTDYGKSGVLNYQHGYIRELVAKLQQRSLVPTAYNVAFPLVWVKQPFTIKRINSGNIWGRVTDLEIYIIQQSEKTITAEERMVKTFKPLLYPIYELMLEQIDAHIGIGTVYGIAPHDMTDFYWWGEEQQAVLNDVVDCIRISNLQLDIYFKNCQPFKSF